ncbi:hypothetical protein CW702_01625, partial [Candidatus Bathyarchaeota archaeon]
LPPIWRDGNKVMNLSEVFNGGYLGVGESVTIKALQRTIINKNGTGISVLVAYEIEGSSYLLHAVLPFNVVSSNE